jgi:hypothetical protein
MQDDPDNLDRLIDEAIDDVARGMTAARVDEAFARRVSARLEDPDTRVSRTWPRAWLLVPASGAVMMALLATSLVRDRNVRPTSFAKATEVEKPDATEAVTTGNVATAVKQPETAQPGSRSVTDTARKPVPPAPAGDFSVEPLATPPLEFAALDVSPLVTMMPIEIQAIAIDRIEIPPMP